LEEGIIFDLSVRLFLILYLNKTTILLKFYNFFFYVRFSSLFRERKKKNEPKRRKKARGKFSAAHRKRARISRRAVFRTGFFRVAENELKPIVASGASDTVM